MEEILPNSDYGADLITIVIVIVPRPLYVEPTMAASASHLEQRYFRDGCMGLCEVTEIVQ